MVHMHIFAILDEQSPREDNVLLVELRNEDEGLYFGSVRCEFEIAVCKLNQYYIGDAGMEEDIEEAEEEGDGVLRIYRNRVVRSHAPNSRP